MTVRLTMMATLVAVLGVMLIACGADDDDADEAADAPGGAASETAPARETQLAAESATAAGSDEARSITVTDVIGRKVTVQVPVDEMLLAEGRLMYVVAALEEDDNPFARVVGWGDDLRTTDKALYDWYAGEYPEISDISVFGSTSQGAFSAESAIDLAPDVVVMTIDSWNGADGTGLVDQLEQAGIPVIVTDFRQYPLENTVPTLHLMGRIMGVEDRAQAVADFYTEHVNLIYNRLEEAEGEKPLTFLYRAAGLGECCGTFGSANLGLFIERAGGTNLGSEFGDIYSLTLNPEQVITSDPEVVIVTGSDWRNYPSASNFVNLGFAIDEVTAREDLQNVIDSAPGWSELRAVSDGRVHAIWHQFYTSPFNFIALLQFAKWEYPELFADVDTEAIFQEFHDEFLPYPYEGTYWVNLE